MDSNECTRDGDSYHDEGSFWFDSVDTWELNTDKHHYLTDFEALGNE